MGASHELDPAIDRANTRRGLEAQRRARPSSSGGACRARLLAPLRFGWTHLNAFYNAPPYEVVPPQRARAGRLGRTPRLRRGAGCTAADRPRSRPSGRHCPAGPDAQSVADSWPRARPFADTGAFANPRTSPNAGSDSGSDAHPPKPTALSAASEGS